MTRLLTDLVKDGCVEFDDSKVSYRLEVETDIDEVRGNAMCSGDDDYDRQVEDELIARLDDGDVWAWASVCVIATYEGIDNIEGRDYLGHCSYTDEADFCQPGGYYDDMRDCARDELYASLEQVVRILTEG